jgi:hypothetical protein
LFPVVGLAFFAAVMHVKAARAALEGTCWSRLTTLEKNRYWHSMRNI